MYATCRGRHGCARAHALTFAAYSNTILSVPLPCSHRPSTHPPQNRPLLLATLCSRLGSKVACCVSFSFYAKIRQEVSLDIQASEMFRDRYKQVNSTATLPELIIRRRYQGKRANTLAKRHPRHTGYIPDRFPPTVSFWLSSEFRGNVSWR